MNHPARGHHRALKFAHVIMGLTRNNEIRIEKNWFPHHLHISMVCSYHPAHFPEKKMKMQTGGFYVWAISLSTQWRSHR